MNIVVGIVNVAFIAYVSYLLWKRDHSPLKTFYWSALIFKLLSGIALGLLYLYYYNGGDTFNYFNDGVKLASLARQDPGSYISFLWSGDESYSIWTELTYKQPRAIFLSKVTSLFCLLTADSYWVISLYFSFISFLCAWILAKKILILNTGSEFAGVLAFLFFPSIVFWSSGVIKESLAMAALFFVCVIFLQLWLKERVGLMRWPLTGFAIWILWNLKYYYIGVFLPVAATALLAKWIFARLKTQSLAIKIIVWSSIFIGPMVLISSLHPNFYPERFLDVVVSSYNEFHAISDDRDVIYYSTMEPTLTSIMKNIPLAIFSGLYRPFITEATTIFQILSAAENFLLLVLTISVLTQIKQLIKGKHRLLTFSLLVYVLILCVFLALSTPNFGTLSRFRIGFLPFFVFLLTAKNPLVTRLIKPNWPANLVP